MISHLPGLNAVLNGSSALLLSAGYFFVKTGRISYHRLCMVTAVLVSATFLISYLTYHAFAGHVRFQGTGMIRSVYFLILATHTILAAVNVPLIFRTLYLATQARFDEHRRLARWTWPSWMYVSVTGVVIYWMLYRL